MILAACLAVALLALHLRYIREPAGLMRLSDRFEAGQTIFHRGRRATVLYSGRKAMVIILRSGLW